MARSDGYGKVSRSRLALDLAALADMSWKVVEDPPLRTDPETGQGEPDRDRQMTALRVALQAKEAALQLCPVLGWTLQDLRDEIKRLDWEIWESEQ